MRISDGSSDVCSSDLAGAITLQRDKLNPKDGLIKRIDLIDVRALAHFLGRSTYADQLALTIEQLEPLKVEFPVILEVMERWSGMTKVRGLGPQDADSWLRSEEGRGGKEGVSRG